MLSHLGRYGLRNVPIQWRTVAASAILLTLIAAPPAFAQGLSPESPAVKAAIASGIKFIESSNDGRLGAKALVGLTLAKDGAYAEHPKIKQAIDAIQAALASGPENFRDDIYSTGAAIMFLVAVDPRKYRYEIEDLVKSLHLRQKTDGAWGYPLDSPNGKTCDTSMTQFALLGLWEAEDQAAVESPPDVWDRAARWLIRTQDPSGGFGYQGVVSSSLNTRVKQNDVRHPMSVAGLCSLFICQDQLGLSQLRKSSLDTTPEAFRLVETADAAKARIKTRLDPKLFQRARADGNHWMSEHGTVTKPNGFLHYYMYALERYESFRQADQTAVGRGNWYAQGARFLLQTQREDGSWESQAKNPPDTCFALLFLLRSTKKALERRADKHEPGILVAGRGLPAAAKVRLRDGRVTPRPEPADLDAVLNSTALTLRETPPEADDLELAIEQLVDAIDAAASESLAAQVERLASLAAHPHQAVRLAANRGLGKSESLDAVPALFKSLLDQNAEVRQSVGQALIFISRRDDLPLPDPNGTADSQASALRAWRDWYRSLRPDAVF